MVKNSLTTVSRTRCCRARNPELASATVSGIRSPNRCKHTFCFDAARACTSRLSSEPPPSAQSPAKLAPCRRRLGHGRCPRCSVRQRSPSAGHRQSPRRRSRSYRDLRPSPGRDPSPAQEVGPVSVLSTDQGQAGGHVDVLRDDGHGTAADTHVGPWRHEGAAEPAREDHRVRSEVRDQMRPSVPATSVCP